MVGSAKVCDTLISESGGRLDVPPWARVPKVKKMRTEIARLTALFLTVTDLRTHASLLSSHLASSFSCSLGTHLAHSPVLFAEIGKPLGIEACHRTEAGAAPGAQICVAARYPTRTPVGNKAKVRSQESGVRRQEAGVRSQESGGRRQESGVRRQESGVRRQESGVRSQESGVRRQEAGVRSQEAGVRSQESGVRSQESGVRRQEAGVRSQEAGGISGNAIPHIPGFEPLIPLHPAQFRFRLNSDSGRFRGYRPPTPTRTFRH